MLDCEFVGFVPDDFLDLYTDAMVRRVAEKAPYESNTHARVERVGERGFRATIEVESGSGTYRSEAVAPDSKLAVDRAEEDIYRQLAHWRRDRFSQDEAA